MEFYSKNDPQHPLISSFMVTLWFYLIKSEIPIRVKKDVLGVSNTSYFKTPNDENIQREL